MDQKGHNRAVLEIEDGGPDGWLVHLRPGWAFNAREREHIRWFDSLTEARKASAIKRLQRCNCNDCR